MNDQAPRLRSAAAIVAAAIPLLLAAAGTARAQDDARTDLEEAAAAAAQDLGPVLVIGRRTPDGVPTVPLNAVGSRDVFGPDRVKETGARDMNDLIHNIPAISTRPYNGGEGSAPSFSMRGLPDDGLTEYIHVLIDGVPASPLQYGWTAFSFLPITTERVYAVDYIRGGHAVRYAPNTVGGILNFVTEPIPVEPTVRFRQTIGNLGYSSSLFSVGGTQDGLGAVFTVVDRSGDGYRDAGDFDQTDWNVKLRLDLDDGAWLAGSVGYFDDFHAAPGGLTLAQYDADRFANARRKNRFEGDRTAADVVYHTPIERGWVEGFTYWSETFRNLIAQRPHFGRPATLSDWTDTSTQWAVGLRFERSVDLGGLEHTFYGGLRYHDESIPSYEIRTSAFAGGPQTATQDTDVAFSAFSAHIDDTVEVADGLTLTAGLRYEDDMIEGKDTLLGFDDDDDFSRVLPGAGASYETSESTAVFANWFEGFRAPQVWGVAYKAPGDALDFELAESTEVGFRFRDWNGLSGQVTRWTQEYDDFGVFYTGFYENLGQIDSDGVDVELAYDFGTLDEALAGLSASASMTSQDSEIASGANDGNDVPYAWSRKSAWTVRYRTTDEWVFSVGGTHVGRSYSDDANTGIDSADGTLGVNPSRTLWDARVAKTIRLSDSADLELAAGMTNATDRSWYVHSRGGFFGGGKVAGPPRQTYLTAGIVVNW